MKKALVELRNRFLQGLTPLLVQNIRETPELLQIGPSKTFSLKPLADHALDLEQALPETRPKPNDK